MDKSDKWIPNIDLGRDYDDRYLGATIHYDVLRNLAAHFGRQMPVHRHAQSVQIHYIENGPVAFHIEDRLYEVDGPCLFLTPAAVPHSFQVAPEASGHVLTLSQSLVWQLMRRTQDTDLEHALTEGLCLYSAGIAEDKHPIWRFITELIGNIREEWQREAPAKHFVLDSLVGLLLAQIARLHEADAFSVDTNNADLHLFNAFNRLVEAHYKDHWQIPQYTEALAVSESRLNQVCKQISHTSPKHLVRERLFKEAKRLLAFTNQSANEIAYALGFNDPAYFSRAFKKLTGLTPLAFRESTQ